MAVTQWKIFYNDGTTYSDKNGLPKSAPIDGVLLIVQKGTGLEDGQFILNGGEYYYWDNEIWKQKWFDPVSGSARGGLANKTDWRKAKVDAITYAKL